MEGVPDEFATGSEEMTDAAEEVCGEAAMSADSAAGRGVEEGSAMSCTGWSGDACVIADAARTEVESGGASANASRDIAGVRGTLSVGTTGADGDLAAGFTR
jgi:hypothetical protein